MTSGALTRPRRMALADLAQAAAGSPHGRVICGVFNMNRAQAVASLRRLADLDVTIVCFGHGEPLTHAAATELQAAARHMSTDTSQNARDRRRAQ